MTSTTSVQAAARGGLALLAAGLMVAAAVAVSACASASAAAATVQVTKPLGTHQCGGGGTSPEALAGVLAAAGVKVLATACGVDGRMHPMVCGADDGRLAVLDIAEADLPRARALGYVPLVPGGDARVVPCR